MLWSEADAGNAQFIHDIQRRGMNRVSAEITQKISMLLEHNDTDAHPGRGHNREAPGSAAQQGEEAPYEGPRRQDPDPDRSVGEPSGSSIRNSIMR